MSLGLYVLRFEYDVCECDFWVLFIFPTWYFLISIIEYFIEFEIFSAIVSWEMLERWMGVCLFLCTSVSRFAYSLRPVPRSEVSGSCLPLLLSTLVLRQGLSVNMKLAAVMASKLQEVSCSASSALGFQTCCPLRLFCRSGVLNSGPLACTTSIFPTEPSPHLVFPFFV